MSQRKRHDRHNAMRRTTSNSGSGSGSTQRAAVQRRGSSSAPFVPAGSMERPIPKHQLDMIAAGTYPGMNQMGANTAPVSGYAPQYSPGLGMVAYPPGDPIRPVPGLDDGAMGPRQFSYPVGVNIVPVPRGTEAVSFADLRNLAALYEGVQLCQGVIFRVLHRLELQIIPRPELLAPGEDTSAEKWQAPARAMLEWFQEPDHRGTDLDAWMTAAMRDLLELDAVGVFHRRTRGGGLYGLELVAGDTVACLHDLGGRSPLPPAPAYQQVLYGVPARLFARDMLDYHRLTARTDSLYGRGPVERIILRINMALRKEHYDITRYTDGATPEGVVQTQLPELIGRMSPEQVRTWETMWNAALAGNSALRVRTKFVPPGFQFTSTRQEEIATELDDYLLHVTVAAHGLSMDELGFTDTSNRSVGDAQENVVYRNAIKPTSDYFAKYFTRLIARYHGTALSPTARSVSVPGAPTKSSAGVWDARFKAQFGGIDEPEDLNTKVGAAVQMVNAGLMGRTEAKHWLKVPVHPDEASVPAMVTVQGGVESLVILEDLLEQREQMKAAAAAQLAAKEAGATQTAHAFATGQMPVQAQGKLAAQVQPPAQEQQQGKQPQHGTQQQKGQGENNDGEGGDSSGGGRGARGSLPGAGAPGGRESARERSDGGGNARSADPASSDTRGSGGSRSSSGGSAASSGGNRYSAERLLGARGTGGDRGDRGDGEFSSREHARSSSRGQRGEEVREVAAGAPDAPGADLVADEWTRYRERAIRCMKRGRWPMPPFASDILPAELHTWVADELQRATTADEVRAVFAEARCREEMATTAAAAGESPELATPVASVTSVAASDVLQEARLAATVTAVDELRTLRAHVLDVLGIGI